MRIALFTDQGAHYRFPVFRAIAESCPDDVAIDFFIPENDSKGLHVLDEVNSELRCSRIKNISLGHRLFYQSGVVSAILRGRYDVIVLWGGATILSNWFALVAAKIRNVRIVFWGHGFYGNEGAVKLAFRSFFYRFADSNFLYGKHAQRILSERLPDANSEVIYNSLDVDRIRDCAESARQQSMGYKWDLIYVGRLTTIKRLDLLIDAVAILQKQGRSLKVLMVGEGEVQSVLMSRASSMSVSDCFEWVGACYEEQRLSDYFSESRFCVSPGNIGLMAMHALYNNTPIITHGDLTNQMPEAEAVQHGENGFLFQREVVSSLSAAINEAMNSDYETLRANCFPSVREHYSPEFQSGVFWSGISKIS